MINTVNEEAIKNTTLQPCNAAIYPPNIGAIAIPISLILPNTLNIFIDDIPPPIPCIHRQMHTQNPPQININNPSIVICLRPYESLNKPPNNDDIYIINEYDNIVNCIHDGDVVVIVICITRN